MSVESDGINWCRYFIWPGSKGQFDSSEDQHYRYLGAL